MIRIISKALFATDKQFKNWLENLNPTHTNKQLKCPNV